MAIIESFRDLATSIPINIRNPMISEATLDNAHSSTGEKTASTKPSRGSKPTMKELATRFVRGSLRKPQTLMSINPLKFLKKKSSASADTDETRSFSGSALEYSSTSTEMVKSNDASNKDVDTDTIDNPIAISRSEGINILHARLFISY